MCLGLSIVSLQVVGAGMREAWALFLVNGSLCRGHSQKKKKKGEKQHFNVSKIRMWQQDQLK